MSDFVSQNIVSQNIVSEDTKTTLNPNFKCHRCGEPAVVYVDRWLYCPACYLKKQGEKIKPLDHAGFYP